MADEKNAHQSSMNMDVLADMISLADKQDVSGETMRTHQKKIIPGLKSRQIP